MRKRDLPMHFEISMIHFFLPRRSPPARWHSPDIAHVQQMCLFFQQVYLYFFYPANISPIPLTHLVLCFLERLLPFSSIITNILFHYLFRLCYFQDFFVLFERILSYHWASSAWSIRFKSSSSLRKELFLPFSTQQISPCQVAFCRYFTCTRNVPIFPL